MIYVSQLSVFLVEVRWSLGIDGVSFLLLSSLEQEIFFPHLCISKWKGLSCHSAYLLENF